MRPPLRLAVLVSGEGTTLDGLAEAIAADGSTVGIALVVSDRPDVPALERAGRRGLRTTVVPYDANQVTSWAEQLTAALALEHVELVVLAGFRSILPSAWVERWHGRAINLHPSLLPKYGGRGMHGRRVHEAVLTAGDRESGVTVHLVTGTVDGGPPVAQQRVPVLPGDTPESLRERLRPVEVELLASTVRRFADGSLPLPYLAEDDRARAARAERGRRG
jgi:phosphoribosylglycinamide formyltransferase-1